LRGGCAAIVFCFVYKLSAISVGVDPLIEPSWEICRMCLRLGESAKEKLYYRDNSTIHTPH